MDESQLLEGMSLEEFIALPDTISLIIRDGSLASEAFSQRHNILTGTALSGDYRINYVNRRQVDGMAIESGENLLSILPIVFGLLDQQSLDAAGIMQAQRHPFLDLRGRGTLLGFVDTGIDYTQRDFQYENGSSKIKYIWDQTIGGNAPEGFYLGTEYSEEQINRALQSENPLEIVPHRDTAGHGTFLASVAAGRENGEYVGAAPEAEIIAVKLKKAEPFFYERYLIPEWQENAFTSSDLLLGIQYIINKAEELGRPVSICIAVGSNMGGHDGFSVTEDFLTRISNTTGIAVACAAGNESQARHHATGRLINSGETQNIELLVGDQAEDIYITLWNGASDRIAVSIRSPTGELVPKIPVRSGSSYSSDLVMEQTRVTIEYYLPIRGSGDQFTIIKMKNPTQGIWTIMVHGEIVLDGIFHSWLPITGFIDPGTVFLTPSPNYTIVTPATAVGVTTCGAYDSRNNSLYTASSWGPTRLPMISPDLVAPGVNVGGLYPTGYGSMSGTSVSAAITAGAGALMLQWGIVHGNEISLTSNRIRANLIRGCIRSESGEYPNPQWGYGRLNLFNALNIIRPM